jgi:hypothetical protein
MHPCWGAYRVITSVDQQSMCLKNWKGVRTSKERCQQCPGLCEGKQIGSVYSAFTQLLLSSTSLGTPCSEERPSTCPCHGLKQIPESALSVRWHRGDSQSFFFFFLFSASFLFQCWCFLRKLQRLGTGVGVWEMGSRWASILLSNSRTNGSKLCAPAHNPFCT